MLCEAMWKNKCSVKLSKESFCHVETKQRLRNVCNNHQDFMEMDCIASSAQVHQTKSQS